MDLFLKARRHFFKKNMVANIPQNHPGRKATNLDNARSVGILFDATAPAERTAAVEFAAKLARLGKKARLLGFIDLPEKKCPADLPFVSFNKKNANWYGRATGEKVEAFCKEKFDLLFCLFSGENRPLEWAAARSSARMKAGGRLAFYKNLDLSVEVGEGGGIAAIVEQLEACLKKLVVAAPREVAVAA